MTRGRAAAEPNTPPAHPYRRLWETRDLEAWAGELSEDVVLHSPILTNAFRGRRAVMQLFEVLLERIAELEIVAEAHDGGTAMFLWRADVTGRTVEGTDVLRRDAQGKIDEIRVLIRPMVDLATFAATVGPAMARNRGRLNGAVMRLLAGPLRTILSTADAVGRRLVQGPDRAPRGHSSASEVDDVRRLLRLAARRFTAVATAAADGSVPVPDTPGWSVADVTAHVAIETDRYARELVGDSDWSSSAEDIAVTNARALADLTERDRGVLSTTIHDNVAAYTQQLASVDPDARTHHLDAGLVIAPRHAAAILLGELVIHGRDIASTIGAQWPIGPSVARRVIDGLWPTMPAWLDRGAAAGHDVTFEIRLRGQGKRRLRIADGQVRVGAEVTTRPDVTISADPEAFLLQMYGRTSLPLTVLRGQMIAWGRRPHLALRLRSLFTTP